MNLTYNLKLFILSFFLVINFNTLALTKVSVDSCNRTVTFENSPERAISNDVNLTEMMLVLGLSDQMVGYTGISGWKTLDEEMRLGVKQLPELSPKYPSKEVLVGADADFFFAGWNYGKVTAEQKRKFMMSNPAFANIDAVKNNRFVTLEYVEATPGPPNIKAIKKLAKAFRN